jgi:hypothetical protein
MTQTSSRANRPSTRVLVPEPRPTSDVPYHHDRAPGQKYLIVDHGVCNDTPVYIALRRVDRVSADQPIWLDLHAHKCNSFYLFIGDGEELEGLEGIVEIDDKHFAVRSPLAAIIPPILLHRYWLTNGSGWYLQITLTPTYEESLVDEASSCVRTAPSLRGEDVLQIGQAERDGWCLIDDILSKTAGISVFVATLRSVETDPIALSPEEVMFDVICGTDGKSSEVVMCDFGSKRTLSTPIAVMSNGRAPTYVARAGTAIVVRIRAARNTGDTGVYSGG